VEKSIITLEQIKDEIRSLRSTERIELYKWLDHDVVAEYGVAADFCPRIGWTDRWRSVIPSNKVPKFALTIRRFSLGKPARMEGCRAKAPRHYSPSQQCFLKDINLHTQAARILECAAQICAIASDPFSAKPIFG
jgi:hypothetical protein